MKDTNRKFCKRIMDRVCLKTCGLSLDDLPDLPCVMNGLDEMEDLIEANGDMTNLSDLHDIAQDAVFELLEAEGFPV